MKKNKGWEKEIRNEIYSMIYTIVDEYGYDGDENTNRKQDLEYIEKRTNKFMNKIRHLLKQQRKDLIRDIKKWAKGKTVTKDKLREYLNTL